MSVALLADGAMNNIAVVDAGGSTRGALMFGMLFGVHAIGGWLPAAFREPAFGSTKSTPREPEPEAKRPTGPEM